MKIFSENRLTKFNGYRILDLMKEKTSQMKTPELIDRLAFDFRKVAQYNPQGLTAVWAKHQATVAYGKFLTPGKAKLVAVMATTVYNQITTKTGAVK